MSKIKYKEFTQEEEEIYDKAIEQIRANIGKGMEFQEACKTVSVKDDELKLLILEDYLKITVAEMHFQQRKSFEEIAGEINVPVDKIIMTYQRMLDDIMHTHKGKLGLNNLEPPELSEPKGNA